MKTCSRCGKKKSLEEFPLQPGMKDGHHSWCKPCKQAAYRDYYQRNREKEIRRSAVNHGRANRKYVGPAFGQRIRNLDAKERAVAARNRVQAEWDRAAMERWAEKGFMS